VVGLERRWAFFDLKQVDLAGRTGILVRSEREYGAPDGRRWAEIRPLGEVVRQRAGVAAESYRLFLVRGRAGSRAAVLRGGGFIAR